MLAVLLDLQSLLSQFSLLWVPSGWSEQSLHDYSYWVCGRLILCLKIGCAEGIKWQITLESSSTLFVPFTFELGLWGYLLSRSSCWVLSLESQAYFRTPCFMCWVQFGYCSTDTETSFWFCVCFGFFFDLGVLNNDVKHSYITNTT